jgi:hypothetical protein
LRNYCNNFNKWTYTGFQWTAIKFYCHKLQVLATTDYVNTLNNVIVVFSPLFLNIPNLQHIF